MTFIVLFLLVATASILTLIQWRRLGRLLYALALLLFIAIGVGILPKYLLSDLQTPYLASAAVADMRWGARNAIVLLGAGTEPAGDKVEAGTFAHGRVARTAALYAACRKAATQCAVIVSGGDAQQRGVAEAVVYAAYLEQLGVDKADLMLETSSRNTWQNAQFSAPLLKPYAGDVVLVTSGIHMRRSLLYFSHFGIEAKPVRADYLAGKGNWFPVAYNFWVTDLALSEYIGVWRYHAYNLLGWNAPAVKATLH
ncbi:uncharacterized SAM-binding protein YcdF (DUF218 family) [Collimonas sp. PA-H2]|uniref:YdcF family protein n=1 Tax=Collimonas sp. PA-H2 TaxID=1881062 RepID=UPI000BF45731|nr:YdcF family protein [Collimonas sp. PA-H2]PFH12072.1 uncharacterized SAM-binding protein YcdF (DUF218 family) [Collimonas sp. PA-H2]